MAILVVDIETCALPNAADYLEAPTAPANYKDPEKIAAYCAEKLAEQRERCPLDPDLCEVAAVGIAGAKGPVEVRTREQESERDLLIWLWSFTEERLIKPVVWLGFNVVGFDLPVLMRRSQYLNVRPPSLSVGKYRHPGIIDLQLQLSFDGARPYRSLRWYARRFGLEVADPVTGADVAALVAVDDWATVSAHCRADVETTRQLAHRLGVLA